MLVIVFVELVVGASTDGVRRVSFWRSARLAMRRRENSLDVYVPLSIGCINVGHNWRQIVRNERRSRPECFESES